MFNILSLSENNSTNGANRLRYVTDDTLAATSRSGYFDLSKFALKFPAGDTTIESFCSDGAQVLDYTNDVLLAENGHPFTSSDQEAVASISTIDAVLAVNLIADSEGEGAVKGSGQDITQGMAVNDGVNVGGRNNAIRFTAPVGGFTQKILDIPPNFDYYTYSFDIKPLDTVGTVSTGNLGISGAGSYAGIIYNVATDTLDPLWAKEDLGEGWFRLTLGRVKLDNRGGGTSFVSRLDSGVDADKVLLSRFQLNVGTIATEYAHTLSGVNQFDKQAVHTLGDSFATSTFKDGMLLHFVDRSAEFSNDGVGGSTLAEQAVRFDGTPGRYSSLLVIMDGGLSDTAAEATGAIDSIIAHLTHDRWVWVQPSPGEDIEGSGARVIWNDRVAEIRAHVGAGHYVETLTALQAGSDGSAADRQDVANNIVPRSLRTDAIHETVEGTTIRTGEVVSFVKGKGW